MRQLSIGSRPLLHTPVWTRLVDKYLKDRTDLP